MIQARKSDTDCKGITRADKDIHWLVIHFQTTLWSIYRNGITKKDAFNLVIWTEDLKKLPPHVFAQC